MKKFFALLLTAVMTACLFTACGESSSNNAASAATDTKSEAAASAATEEKSEAAAPVADNGQTYNFIVVNHDAQTSMGERWLESLFNAISEESNGRLTFTYQPGGSLFGATETIDAVKEGSADICWWTTGTYGGRFPLSEFVNLVGNGVNSAQLGSAVIQFSHQHS